MSSQSNKYSNPNLTDKDIKIFEAKKANYFKGSIAVAVVYGVVALSLILLAALSDAGRTMIMNNLRPFVITLAIGIIIVVTVIVLQLNSLEPTVLKTVEYDGQMCPDYWTLQETPLDVLNGMSEEARMYAKTRCVRDTKVMANVNPVTYPEPADTNDVLNTSARAYLSGTNMSTVGAMNCNTLYPVALGLTDEKAYPSAPNTLRCDIANKCGFAWSSVC